MNRIVKTDFCAVLAITLCACGQKREASGESAGTNACNPHSCLITSLESVQLPMSLPDLDAGVINGNYVLESGLNEKNPAVAIEEFIAETSVKRTNYIAVREGNENPGKIRALIIQAAQTPFIAVRL